MAQPVFAAPARRRLPHFAFWVRRLATVAAWASLSAGLIVWSGCRPQAPFYLKGGGEMKDYMDRATAVEFPDASGSQLPEVTGARAPILLSQQQFDNYWDLTLEDTISIGLHNSKVLKNISALPAQRGLLQNAFGFATIYDPAIIESDPINGVEGALSVFDAQLNSGLDVAQTDRPQNITPDVAFFTAPVAQQTNARYSTELTKRAATGTEMFFRNTVDYNLTNAPAVALPSSWTTAIEAEIRQPLLRGRGELVNRAPVVLARMRQDQAITDFEFAVRRYVFDLEQTYWQLYSDYWNYQTLKQARNSTLATWKTAVLREPIDGRRPIATAEAQYHNFNAQVDQAWGQLLSRENDLRLLMGIAATDGRVIRPVQEPVSAKVVFDWTTAQAEALVRLPELRRQKWAIKQRELELLVARNDLLPTLNTRALYRWLGVGDKLINSGGSGVRFPSPGSNSVEELLIGDYQEFSYGLEFNMPIGFRQALAGVRNAQLSLAREKARLEEEELAAIAALSQAIRDADVQYHLIEKFLNQSASTERELELSRQLVESGVESSEVRTVIDLVLEAEVRRANAQGLFYSAQAQYCIAIANVHFNRGSLLEYNNVLLEEGPWPAKAVWDAQQNARRRAAGHYIDYGYTRPGVISRGVVPQTTGMPEVCPPGMDGTGTPLPVAMPPGSPLGAAAAGSLPANNGETLPRPGVTSPGASVPGSSSGPRSGVETLPFGTPGPPVPQTSPSDRPVPGGPPAAAPNGNSGTYRGPGVPRGTGVSASNSPSGVAAPLGRSTASVENGADAETYAVQPTATTAESTAFRRLPQKPGGDIQPVGFAR